jgi:hypothetical protein
MRLTPALVKKSGYKNTIIVTNKINLPLKIIYKKRYNYNS